MMFLRKASLRAKLMFIIMSASGLALFFTGSAMIIYDYFSFNRHLEEIMDARADYIIDPAILVLFSDDNETGKDLLKTQGGDLVAGRIFAIRTNQTPRIIAEYQASKDYQMPFEIMNETKPGIYRTKGRMQIIKALPDKEVNANLGFVFLDCSLNRLYQRIENSVITIALIILIAFAVGTLLFGRLHRIVTEPIFHLAGTANRIAQEKDYALRASKRTDDEVGHLIECFNEMVTQIQNRDAELRKAHNELEERVKLRTQELSLAYSRLKEETAEKAGLEAQLRQAQKMEAVGQLAGGVAHDFNNLLTVIIGNTELLQENSLPENGKQEVYKEIAEAALRAAELTRQLLAFSRRQMMQVSSVNLNEVLSNITRMLQRLIGEHIFLQMDFAPDLPAIEADVHMLEQIVVNLAVNARDAMPNGGKLMIKSSLQHISKEHAKDHIDATEGPHICLTVTDTGSGIEPHYLQKIFEPFFTTKPVGKGTGLGLATVYGIAKQHRGWIEVNSTVGVGSAFTVFFPKSTIMFESNENDEFSFGDLMGSETILVVEDEISVRNLMCRSLTHYGYNVITANNGRQALSIWQEKSHSIDLLLTDMVMPEGITGRELAAKLLADKPNLKVIYTSGYSEEIQMGGLIDADNFISKPFNPTALAQNIRKKLDQNTAA